MATNSYWRARAQAVIAKVMAAHPGVSEDVLRKRISEAYPFGERAYHPYKIWLDEVKRTFERHTTAVPLPRAQPSAKDYQDFPLFGGEG